MARNCRFPDLETYGSQRFPTWEPEVTIARNCRFPEVIILCFRSLAAIIVRNCGFPKLETHGSKPEKVTFPVEGSVDCKKLELMVLNVFFWFTEPVTEPFVLECLRLAVGPA